MADAADKAAQLQQQINDVALVNYRRQHQIKLRTSTECIDCGGDIESQRLSLLSAERCIECQTDFEKRDAFYGKRK